MVILTHPGMAISRGPRIRRVDLIGRRHDDVAGFDIYLRHALRGERDQHETAVVSADFKTGTGTVIMHRRNDAGRRPVRADRRQANQIGEVIFFGLGRG